MCTGVQDDVVSWHQESKFVSRFYTVREGYLKKKKTFEIKNLGTGTGTGT
jgi:hypothetical protein